MTRRGGPEYRGAHPTSLRLCRYGEAMRAWMAQATLTSGCGQCRYQTRPVKSVASGYSSLRQSDQKEYYGR